MLAELQTLLPHRLVRIEGIGEDLLERLLLIVVVSFEQLPRSPEANGGGSSARVRGIEIHIKCQVPPVRL